MTYLWLTLNALDAVLTILIIRAGGIEVMPIASWLTRQSIWLFVGFKALGSLLALRLLKKYPNAVPVVNGAFITIVAINGVSLWYLS